MDILLRSLLTMVGSLVPVIIVVLVMNRKRRAWRRRNKDPFPELSRRPAGEYLRLKIEGLSEIINDWSMYMVVVPLLVPHVLAQAGWPGNLVLALSLLVSVLWSGSCGMKIHRL